MFYNRATIFATLRSFFLVRYVCSLLEWHHGRKRTFVHSVIGSFVFRKLIRLWCSPAHASPEALFFESLTLSSSLALNPHGALSSEGDLLNRRQISNHI